MILKCSCKHVYQDQRYGTGKRVHNRCTKEKAVTYRCTVCSAIKQPDSYEGVNYEN